MKYQELRQIVEQSIGKIKFENNQDYVPNEFNSENDSKTTLSTQIQGIMYSVENDIPVNNDSDEEDDLYTIISYLKKAKELLEKIRTLI